MASELKVNKITPESGVTLTLGDLGDTINFGSGVLPNFENLTVTGDLTVDTNSLKVDSTNNFVGIGTASPTVALDVVGAITATGNITGTLATAAQPNITSLGTLTGLTTTGDINFGDNDKAVFGAGNDLQIYHDGSNSYIDDVGTGNMFIRADDYVIIDKSDSSKRSASFNTDDAVILYFNNNQKFTTTSTGIDVTGNASADIINIYNASEQGRLNVSNNGAEQLEVFPGDVSNKVTLQAFNRSTVASSSFRYIASTHEFTAGGSERMRIDSSGNVGIGSSTARGRLTVSDGNTNSAGEAVYQAYIVGTARNFTSDATGMLTIQSTDNMGADKGGSIAFGGRAITGNASGANWAGISGFKENSTSAQYGGYLGFSVRNNVGGGALAEAMRINSSGNVGIGTSSPASKLEVEDSVNGDMHLRINNTNTGSSARTLLLLESDGATGSLYLNGANRVSSGVDEADSMTLTSDASASNGLNINTTSGSMKFYYNYLEKMRINSSGNVGIGESSPDTKLHVKAGSSGTETAFADSVITLENSGNSRLQFLSGNTSQGEIMFGDGDLNRQGRITYDHSDDSLRLQTTNAERMRITSSGDILINKTANSFTTAGVILNSAGNCFFTASGNSGVNVNRLSDDGALVRFYQANSEEGSISVSGSTVSYNGFTGTHWSRLADNSKPTILKGTILESLDEMMDWYQVQFDITENDDEGKETTRTEKQSYALGDGESVGDVITYNYEGTDYQATIIQEDDIKHTKSKISDTVDAKNVYGVFMAWDNDDDTVNDMYVAQTGTFVVRMNSAETVSKGDLIQSNGDGTGKVQADDLLRASTVAKVLSTTKIETYDDGSYIVPCSLHC
jgi:hypothetical protein